MSTNSPDKAIEAEEKITTTSELQEIKELFKVFGNRISSVEKKLEELTSLSPLIYRSLTDEGKVKRIVEKLKVDMRVSATEVEHMFNITRPTALKLIKLANKEVESSIILGGWSHSEMVLLLIVDNNKIELGIMTTIRDLRVKGKGATKTILALKHYGNYDDKELAYIIQEIVKRTNRKITVDDMRNKPLLERRLVHH